MLIFITGVMVGCASKKSGKEDIISEEAFSQIMIDLVIADAGVSYELGQDMDAQNILYGNYKYVFDEHNITKEAFKEAFNYYAQDLERMTAIYAKVEQEMGEIQSKLNEQQAKSQSSREVE